jgi:hypothetical protein
MEELDAPEGSRRRRPDLAISGGEEHMNMGRGICFVLGLVTGAMFPWFAQFVLITAAVLLVLVWTGTVPRPKKPRERW